MKKHCQVCGGKGKVPDVSLSEPMTCCGPNGGSWPEVTCQCCWGLGYACKWPVSVLILLLLATSLLIGLLLAMPAVACDKGCEDHDGVCACSAVPEQAAPTVQPSDEKPPHNPQPESEMGNMIIDMPPSLAAQDAKLDQEKAKADAEGKRKAQIP